MQDRIKSRAEQEVSQRNGGRDVPGLVRELYVEKRFSDREIAAALGVHRVTITNWRAEWGISREDRPTAAEATA
ncbi:MAG TPA: helix-turn-helix domain-containing protein [Candidatus Limnocylindrales bacterium]|jgi:transposase|nr:helix-turn-helix domain-containing protein [Candidatus Limnocylindrales bacterium]